DPEATLLPAGKIQGKRVRAVREPDGLDDARDRLLGHVVVEEARPVGDGFPGSQAIERLEVLGQDAHAFPDAAISRPDVLTKNPSLPGRRVAQTLGSRRWSSCPRR